MTSKPLFQVQEDIRNLQQQLLLVSNGLQRNQTAIEKLKRETTQVGYPIEPAADQRNSNIFSIIFIFSHINFHSYDHWFYSHYRS